jgi:hypothetical protein
MLFKKVEGSRGATPLVVVPPFWRLGDQVSKMEVWGWWEDADEMCLHDFFGQPPNLEGLSILIQDPNAALVGKKCEDIFLIIG